MAAHCTYIIVHTVIPILLSLKQEWPKQKLDARKSVKKLRLAPEK